ncbi:glycosyltransferase family 2 protein [Variovorax atrisoli]|uniref:glycosyltransferase family 2 protein n=1 Tax=Variovorax atrisoli TaxID=3394203 RepID=UPI0033926434
MLSIFRKKELQRRPDVTVVLTSCDRHDLLEKTLASFVQFNTYAGVKEIIVVEDGTADPAAICSKFGARLIRIGRRAGQVNAIDTAYAQVTTPYVFHLEDDWEFYKPGFIEKSKALLDLDPSTMQVWLRAWDDTNGHPLSFQSDDDMFGVIALDVHGVWSGFSFNPGLRRISDYKKLGTYGAVQRATEGHHYEVAISLKYRELGYRAVILEKNGYVRHIGWDRHVE